MAGVVLATRVLVVSQIFRRDKPESFAIPLAVAGGVFRHSARTRQSFDEHVRKFDPRIVISSQVVEPVVGALQIARSGLKTG
jgi:hypothetical protein